MNTKVTDDIDLEQWLSEMPAPPVAVCDRLEAAGVHAYLWRRDTKSVWMRIHSTFANLPVIQQILIESGVNPLSGIHRFKWPRPRSPKRRLSMSIRFKWAGPPLSVREREGLLMTKYIKEGENGIRLARLDSATTPEEVQAALYGVL